MSRELTPAEQLAEFSQQWQARNSNLNGHARPPTPRVPPNPLGIAGAVLGAARALPGPFDLTTLILVCWQADPLRFGLQGCEEIHPDPNRVRCCVFGKRGLVAKGWLTKLPDGRYEVGNG